MFLLAAGKLLSGIESGTPARVGRLSEARRLRRVFGDFYLAKLGARKERSGLALLIGAKEAGCGLA
jgi:hypothetical protein